MDNVPQKVYFHMVQQFYFQIYPKELKTGAWKICILSYSLYNIYNSKEVETILMLING